MGTSNGFVIDVWENESHADALARVVRFRQIQFPIEITGHQFFDMGQRVYDKDLPIKISCIEDVPLRNVIFNRSGNYAIRYIRFEPESHFA